MPLSEFSLIYRYFASLGRGPGVELSVGDDCALLRLSDNERLAVSTDTMVNGVHFPEDSFPEDVGYRAVATAASDLAAMGARPLGMTLALVLPESDELWLTAFSQGIAAAVAEYGLPLVGGDTTRGPLCITVQVMGALPLQQALRRDGACVGDRVYVSGTLGDAGAALALLQGQWRPAPEHGEYLLQRFNRPTARLALGQSLLGVASAAVDVSDGLLADAGHIAAASGVRILIDPDLIPLSEALQSVEDRPQVLRWALAGGDDYELCFCLPAEHTAPPGSTCIGEVRDGEGVQCNHGVDMPDGYQHFSD